MQICFATGARKENQSTIGLYVRIESEKHIFTVCFHKEARISKTLISQCVQNDSHHYHK